MEYAEKETLQSFREALEGGGSRLDQIEKEEQEEEEEEEYEYVDEETQRRRETEYKDIAQSSSSEDEKKQPLRKRRRRVVAKPSPAQEKTKIGEVPMDDPLNTVIDPLLFDPMKPKPSAARAHARASTTTSEKTEPTANATTPAASTSSALSGGNTAAASAPTKSGETTAPSFSISSVTPSSSTLESLFPSSASANRITGAGAGGSAPHTPAAQNARAAPSENVPPKITPAKRSATSSGQKPQGGEQKKPVRRIRTFQPALQPAYKPGVWEDERPPNGMPPLDNDGYFWFYYIDAHEEQISRTQIKVMLFGKVQVRDKYRNCCVVVDRMERNVFFVLTNQGDKSDHRANAGEAWEEVSGLRSKYALPKITGAPAVRTYPFEKTLPFPHGKLQCLKVKYDCNSPALPSNLKGTHFCQVFGTNTSPLELLLKKRRVKGPMWMKIRVCGSAGIRYSHCPYEVHIDNHKSIETFEKKKGHHVPKKDAPSEVPPLQLLTLAIKTATRKTTKWESEEWQEPVCVTMNYHPHLSANATNDHYAQMERELYFFAFFVGPRFDIPPELASRFNRQNTQIITCDSEPDMLQRILDLVNKLDPDILIQHNAYGVGLDILGQRLEAHRMQTWHMLSRLNHAYRNKPEPLQRRFRDNGGFFGGRQLTVGRLVCDTLLSAREFLGKQTSYELSKLCTTILKQPDFGDYNLDAPLPNDPGSHWGPFVIHTMIESQLCFRLVGVLQVIPLTKQLTNVAGNSWNHSLQNKRAERNEYLLMHEFHDEKCICPDKENKYNKKDDAGAGDGGDAPAGAGGKRQKASYSGGLVLEPVAGLYDDFVMMLDFNSLYPSLIQEFNICFTTVERPRGDHVSKMDEQELLSQTVPPTNTRDDAEGILPRVIRRLVQSRRQVKEQMKTEKDSARRAQQEIRQKALKLTANSMYGCLGFSNSRFYAKPLAALITARGRAALQNTVDMITNKLKFEVIYGDTDSVFTRSFTKDYGEAIQVAQKIKHEVNKKYRKLEIDIDGIFSRLLLLKKKKYAGIKVIDWEKKIFEHEYKGLDLVRRDWCELSKRMGIAILERILSDMPPEEALDWMHEYLRTIAASVDAGEIGHEEYVITKALTKHPKDYPDAKNQPHVQVALRMLQAGDIVNSSQEIPYIVCKTGSSSMALSSRHPSELQADANLQVDTEWYKKHQLHPPILRLLGPIQGTDAAKLAECLGLDSAKFIMSEFVQYEPEISYDSILEPTERFKKLVLGFQLVCPSCEQTVALPEALQVDENLLFQDTASGDAICPKCKQVIDPIIFESQTLFGIRQIMDKYACGGMKCMDNTCERGKDIISYEVGLRALGAKCEACKGPLVKVFSDKDLQNQLDLLEYLLSLVTKTVSGKEHLFAKPKAVIESIQDNSAYNWIRSDFFVSIFGP